MKQSDIRPGLPVMISLGGRKGSIRTIVLYQQSRPSILYNQPIWTVETSDGREYDVTPRQMKPVPVTDRDGNFLRFEHESGAVDSGQRGPLASETSRKVSK